MAFNKGKYQHYKGPLYEVLDIVLHSETEEQLVLYKPLNKSSKAQQHLWVRPYDMFFEQVEYEGKKIARFTFIED